MSRLVVFPSDPIEAYLKQGKSYKYLEGYFNPGLFFDEVFAISLYGKNETIGSIHYLQCKTKEIHSVIKSIKPDVVRAYGGYISSDLAYLSKVEGIPIVVSVHDTNPNLLYESLQYADYVICTSNCVRKAVIDKTGYDERYMWVLPNRIDSKLFYRHVNHTEIENLNNLFGRKKHILHVGRKSYEKNLETLIKALKYLPDDTVAIFVGTGDDNSYKRIAIENGVSERCYWVESVKKDELPYWYSWCDCFCTPSRWEGFGFVFIEAAGCEAPIVTSNIAPMNEYLTNNKDALLVDDYENPRALANAIGYCLSNDVNVEIMRHNARKVGMKFDKKIVDSKEIDIYKEIMKKGVRVTYDDASLRRKLILRYRKKSHKIIISNIVLKALRRIKSAI